MTTIDYVSDFRTVWKGWRNSSSWELGGDIVSCIGRRRDTSANGPIPIDIGIPQEEEFAYYVPEFLFSGGTEGPWGLDEDVWNHPDGVVWEDVACDCVQTSPMPSAKKRPEVVVDKRASLLALPSVSLFEPCL